MTGRYSFHWQHYAEETRNELKKQYEVLDNINSSNEQKEKAKDTIDKLVKDLLSLGYSLQDVYNM